MFDPDPDSRAVSPVVGIVLLVAVTAVLATAVGAATLGADPPDRPTRAALSLDVDAGTDRVALVHEGGTPLATDDLRVRVSVGGEPLAHQPPVPFFAARGFESGPTGPFNPATGDAWTAGETASLRLAATNEPLPDPGERVRVEVYAGGEPVADLRGRA